MVLCSIIVWELPSRRFTRECQSGPFHTMPAPHRSPKRLPYLYWYQLSRRCGKRAWKGMFLFLPLRVLLRGSNARASSGESRSKEIVAAVIGNGDSSVLQRRIGLEFVATQRTN